MTIFNMSLMSTSFLLINSSFLLSSGSAFVSTTNHLQVLSKVSPLAPSLITKNEFDEQNERVERDITSLQSHRVTTYEDYEELENVLVETEAKVSPTLGEMYSKLTTDYYLTMAFLQSAVIALGADVLTQKLEGADPIDFGHVFAIMVIAATASGAWNANALRKLEKIFPGKETKNVSIKAVLSTLILGGVINAAYLIGVPLLDSTLFSFTHVPAGLHLPPLDTNVKDVVLQGWNSAEFITLTKVECLMFLPYHSLAFKFIPAQLRPLTQAGMAGTFNVIVSAVTLGFFDVWCDRAVCYFQHLL